MLSHIKEKIMYRIKREKDILFHHAKPDMSDEMFGGMMEIFAGSSLTFIAIIFFIHIGFITDILRLDIVMTAGIVLAALFEEIHSP